MADYFRKTKSLYASTTNTFGTGTSVTITPNSVAGLPTDTEITLTFDRVDSSGTATPSAMERIIGTISGGNFVVRTSPATGRGADGTSDAAHTSPVVEYIPNAKDINDTVDGLLVEHLQTGKHGNVTASTVNIGTTIALTGALDSDIMSGVSATTVSTSESIKAYVDSAIQTAADGATVTFDLGTGAYRKHKVTLGGNRTLALSNVLVGQPFIIDLIQDATGSRTVTWFSTIKWVGGTPPTLTTTANKIDSFGFICTSSGNYQGYVIGQNL